MLPKFAALQATEADKALGRHETVCRKVQNTGLKLLCNIAEGSGAKRKPSARHKARKGTSPGGGTQDRRTVPDGFRE